MFTQCSKNNLSTDNFEEVERVQEENQNNPEKKLFNFDKRFKSIAFKVDKVVDPTGAGDCFIGGIAGYLTQSKNISFDTIKSAIAYGTSIASYNVENIGTKNLLNLSINDIKTRINKLH